MPGSSYSVNLSEHVQDVAKLLDKIEASVEKDLMAPALPVTSSETLPAATTLGMAYDDSCVVSRVLIGGPAFLSGKIAEGDTLLAINGVSLTGIYGSMLDEDAIVKLLVGDDIPGSECQVCVRVSVCVSVCLCVVCASPPCMLACVRSCVCESLSIQTCRWTSGALKAGQTRP